MTTKQIFRKKLRTLWCGKRKRPNALIYKHRTPTACFLFIPKIINHDCKNQFGR